LILIHLHRNDSSPGIALAASAIDVNVVFVAAMITPMLRRSSGVSPCSCHA
jgi:hypothetical protein